MHIVLYTVVDAQCDKTVQGLRSNVNHRKYCQLSLTNDGHQFVTLSIHF